LPAIPQRSSASGLSQTQKDGSETFKRSSSAGNSGSGLQLDGSNGQLSWAIWELNNEDELLFLDIDASIAPASVQSGGVFLALANYSRQAWDIFGPVASGQVLELDPAAHRAPGGAVYAAALSLDGSSARVQQLKLLAQQANELPTASLSASRTSGPAPLAVRFDASLSTDEDGEIVAYRWDFDGDGLTDAATAGPLSGHTYALGGSFNAKVEVVDADGGSAMAGVEISAGLFDYQSSDIVTLTDQSEDFDAEMVDGFPALLYDDPQTSSTRYVRALDPLGETWGTPAIADGDPSRALDFGIVAGRPAFLNIDEANSELVYCRAQDSVGTSWGSNVTLGPTGAGLFCSRPILLIVNGRPAAFFEEHSEDLSIRHLAYIRADDSNGDAWPAAATIISQPGQGLNRLAALVCAGRPAAFVYSNGFSVRRANDSDGSSWPVDAQPIEATTDVDGDLSAVLVEGRPCLGFRSNNFFCLLQCNDDECLDWQLPRQVDSFIDFSDHRLATIGGMPFIACTSDRSAENQPALFAAEDPFMHSFSSMLEMSSNTVIDLQLLDMNGSVGLVFQRESDFMLRLVHPDLP
jgi:hypothetical protein